MNYLMEPSGAARTYGAMAGVSTSRLERLWKAGDFAAAVEYVGNKPRKDRVAAYAYLKKLGATEEQLKAFRAAVGEVLARNRAANAEGPNYLLLGGVAAAVLGGGYLLWTKVIKKRSNR